MKISHIALLTVALASLIASAGCGGGMAGSASSSAVSETAAAGSRAVPPIKEDSRLLGVRAVTAYGKNDNDSALSLADQALEKDPNNYEALSLKGIITAFEADPEAGAQYIQKALDIYPDYTQAFYDMAMAKKLGKHYDESIAYFQKVLDKDPGNTWSYYGIATDYADKRDKAHALQYLKKAVQLDPDDVKPEAAIQDHFQWLHGDADFEKLVQ